MSDVPEIQVVPRDVILAVLDKLNLAWSGRPHILVDRSDVADALCALLNSPEQMKRNVPMLMAVLTENDALRADVERLAKERDAALCGARIADDDGLRCCGCYQCDATTHRLGCYASAPEKASS